MMRCERAHGWRMLDSESLAARARSGVRWVASASLDQERYARDDLANGPLGCSLARRCPQFFGSPSEHVFGTIPRVLALLRAMWWVLPVLVLSTSLSARAAEGSDGTHARLETLLAEGIELRRANRDSEALVLFRQAAKLAPGSAEVAAHLGSTYQALGEWLSADTYLSEALRQRQDPFVVRHQVALERALAVVGDHIGSIEVEGGPAGADVFLDGRLVGNLPMSVPVRATVGSYLMEVKLRGHYGVTRPVSIVAQRLVRENVQLVAHSPVEATQSSVQNAALPREPQGFVGQTDVLPVEQDSEASGSGWVPWVLGGLAAGAAVTSGVAWWVRERSARRYNDDSNCLAVGMTRDELCGDEREKGERAQTVAIVSGAAAVVLGTAAYLSAVLQPSGSPQQTRAGFSGCDVSLAPGSAGASRAGFAGATCFGSF